MHAPGQLLNWSCERYYWKYVASYICFKRNSLNKNKKHINVYEYFGMLKMYWKLIIEVWYYVRSRIFFQCVSLVYSTWCNIDVSIKHFLWGGGSFVFSGGKHTKKILVWHRANRFWIWEKIHIHKLFHASDHFMISLGFSVIPKNQLDCVFRMRWDILAH